jgi:hypothetical protein
MVITTDTRFTYENRVSTLAITTITFGVTGFGENLSESTLGELALADIALQQTKKWEVESVGARYVDEEFIVKVHSVPAS